MQLSPELIQSLTTIAFCLEPLSEKSGCTTRLIDMPGKPLTDFIIAGVNSGKYFRYLAEDLYQDKDTPTFKYYVPALQSSNILKSSKVINFGLLELMFLAVKARILEDRKEMVTKKMINLMKQKSESDVQNLINAHLEGWKTSRKESRKTARAEDFVSPESPYVLYENFFRKYSSTDSSYQWALQYKNNLALIDSIMKTLANRTDYLETMENAFREVSIKESRLKPGIIADFCATALFLHLSYQ